MTELAAEATCLWLENNVSDCHATLQKLEVESKAESKLSHNLLVVEHQLHGCSDADRLLTQLEAITNERLGAEDASLADGGIGGSASGAGPSGAAPAARPRSSGAQDAPSLTPLLDDVVTCNINKATLLFRSQRYAAAASLLEPLVLPSPPGGSSLGHGLGLGLGLGLGPGAGLLGPGSGGFGAAEGALEGLSEGSAVRALCLLLDIYIEWRQLPQAVAVLHAFERLQGQLAAAYGGGGGAVGAATAAAGAGRRPRALSLPRVSSWSSAPVVRSRELLDSQGRPPAAPDLRLLVKLYRSRLHALAHNARAAKGELKAVTAAVGGPALAPSPYGSPAAAAYACGTGTGTGVGVGVEPAGLLLLASLRCQLELYRGRLRKATKLLTSMLQQQECTAAAAAAALQQQQGSAAAAAAATPAKGRSTGARAPAAAATPPRPAAATGQDAAGQAGVGAAAAAGGAAGGGATGGSAPPLRPLLLNNLALVHHQQGKHALALLCLTQALQEGNGNGGAEQQQQQQQQLSQQQQGQQQRQHAGVGPTGGAAAAGASGHVPRCAVLYNAGLQYLMLGDHGAARRCFAEAAPQYGDTPLLWLRTAEAALGCYRTAQQQQQQQQQLLQRQTPAGQAAANGAGAGADGCGCDGADGGGGPELLLSEAIAALRTAQDLLDEQQAALEQWQSSSSRSGPGASGPHTSLPPTMVSAPSATLPMHPQLQHLLLQQQSPLAPTPQQQATAASGLLGHPDAGAHTDLFLPLPPAFELGPEGGAGDQRGAGEGPQASMDASPQRGEQQQQQEAAGEAAQSQGQHGHVANGLHPHHGTDAAAALAEELSAVRRAVLANLSYAQLAAGDWVGALVTAQALGELSAGGAGEVPVAPLATDANGTAGASHTHAGPPASVGTFAAGGQSALPNGGGAGPAGGTAASECGLAEYTFLATSYAAEALCRLGRHADAVECLSLWLARAQEAEAAEPPPPPQAAAARPSPGHRYASASADDDQAENEECGSGGGGGGGREVHPLGNAAAVAALAGPAALAATYGNLAAVFASQGEVAQGAALARQALALQPERRGARMLAAYCELAGGHVEAALALLRPTPPPR